MHWVMVSAWTAGMVGIVLFPPLALLTGATFAIVRPQTSRGAFLCFGIPAVLVVAAFFIWASAVGFFRLSAEVPIIWPGVPGVVVGTAAAVTAAAYLGRAIKRRLDKFH